MMWARSASDETTRSRDLKASEVMPWHPWMAVNVMCVTVNCLNHITQTQLLKLGSVILEHAGYSTTVALLNRPRAVPAMVVQCLCLCECASV